MLFTSQSQPREILTSRLLNCILDEMWDIKQTSAYRSVHVQADKWGSQTGSDANIAHTKSSFLLLHMFGAGDWTTNRDRVLFFWVAKVAELPYCRSLLENRLRSSPQITQGPPTHNLTMLRGRKHSLCFLITTPNTDRKHWLICGHGERLWRHFHTAGLVPPLPQISFFLFGFSLYSHFFINYDI